MARTSLLYPSPSSTKRIKLGGERGVCAESRESSHVHGTEISVGGEKSRRGRFSGRKGRGEDDFRRETSGAYIYGGIETSWESFWSQLR